MSEKAAGSVLRLKYAARYRDMINRRILLSFITGISCTAIAAYGQVPTWTTVLPPVGLAATETAEINILSSAASYAGDAFVTTCQASVTFYGTDGSALGAATTFTVGNTRQIFSAELPYALTGAKAPRTVVSAQIALTPNPSVSSVLAPPMPVCAVAFSFDTYDTATGVTHVFVPGQAAQGATDVATVGVVRRPQPPLRGSIPKQ
jgi:hypothetical protein